eukprot:COSAG02_NODE_14285_length_1289_cov_274.597262_1_plen_97_part_00
MIRSVSSSGLASGVRPGISIVAVPISIWHFVCFSETGVIGGVTVFFLIRSSAARLDGEAKLYFNQSLLFVHRVEPLNVLAPLLGAHTLKSNHIWLY